MSMTHHHPHHYMTNSLAQSSHHHHGGSSSATASGTTGGGVTPHQPASTSHQPPSPRRPPFVKVSKKTVRWLQQRYEASPTDSVPKEVVYNEYRNFCLSINREPKSIAILGKILKRVFPGIYPRRLGTRGSSTAHYSGIRHTDNAQAIIQPPASLPTSTVNRGGVSQQKQQQQQLQHNNLRRNSVHAQQTTSSSLEEDIDSEENELDEDEEETSTKSIVENKGHFKRALRTTKRKRPIGRPKKNGTHLRGKPRNLTARFNGHKDNYEDDEDDDDYEDGDDGDYHDANGDDDDDFKPRKRKRSESSPSSVHLSRSSSTEGNDSTVVKSLVEEFNRDSRSSSLSWLHTNGLHAKVKTSPTSTPPQSLHTPPRQRSPHRQHSLSSSSATDDILQAAHRAAAASNSPSGSMSAPRDVATSRLWGYIQSYLTNWRAVIPLASLSAPDLERCFFTTAEDNPTVDNFVVKTALYLGCFGQCDYRSAREYFLQARSLLPYLNAYADARLIVPLLAFAFFAELYYDVNEYLNMAFRCTLSALNLCFTQNAAELQPFANSMYCWLMLVAASFSYTPPLLPQPIAERLLTGKNVALRDKYAWHWLHRMEGPAFLVALNQVFLDASRSILRAIYPQNGVNATASITTTSSSTSSSSTSATTVSLYTSIPSPSLQRRSFGSIPTITTTTTTTVSAMITDELGPSNGEGMLKPGSWSTNEGRSSFDIDLSSWATTVSCDGDEIGGAHGFPGMWGDSLWSGDDSQSCRDIADIKYHQGRSPDVRSSCVTMMESTPATPSLTACASQPVIMPPLPQSRTMEKQEMIDLENLNVLETNLRMAYCQLCSQTQPSPATLRRESGSRSPLDMGASPRQQNSPRATTASPPPFGMPLPTTPPSPSTFTAGLSPTILGLLQSKIMCTLVLLHWKCGGEEEHRLQTQRKPGSQGVEEDEYENGNTNNGSNNNNNDSNMLPPWMSGAKTRSMLSALTYCSELERILQLQQPQQQPSTLSAHVTSPDPHQHHHRRESTTSPIHGDESSNGGRDSKSDFTNISGGGAGGWLLAHVAQDMHMVAEVLNVLGRTEHISQFTNTLTQGVLHPPGPMPDENHGVVNLGRVLCRWST